MYQLSEGVERPEQTPVLRGITHRKVTGTSIQAFVSGLDLHRAVEPTFGER